MLMLGLLGAVLVFIAFVVIFSPSDEELSARMQPAATIRSEPSSPVRGAEDKQRPTSRRHESQAAEVDAAECDAEVTANAGGGAELGNM